MSDLSQQDWAANAQADEQAILIDVRTQEEIEEGMIPQSLHIDIMNPPAFMEAVEQLDKSKNYYIYCRSGGRSGQACQIMQQLGFTNTYNLTGGFMSWEGATTIPTDN